MCFENTVEKGEIVRNEQLLLFPQCFLPVWINFWCFYQIWNCCLQTLSVWTSLNIFVWEMVQSLDHIMGGVSDARMYFLVFSHQYLHNFPYKAINFFSHMKNLQKENLQQPNTKPTTSRSQARYTTKQVTQK